MNVLSPASGPVDLPDNRPGLVLTSPLAGWVMALADVPDPIFAEGILGDGIAIDPIEGVLRAPCDGLVATLHRARHALTLRTADGAEILMHIGIDTVALNGDGFTPQVAEGQTVKAGDPLIVFDMAALAGKARSLVVPVVVMAGGTHGVALPLVDRSVAAGDPLLIVVAQDGQAVGGSAHGGGDIPADAQTAPPVQRQARMRDPHGIHARPAGLLADRARQFDAEITLTANGRAASARSAVSLMLLGVAQGDMVSITAQGRQAQEAADAIAQLIDDAVGARVDLGPATPCSPAPVPPRTDVIPPPVPSPPVVLPPFAKDQPVDLPAVLAAPGLAVGQAVRLVREALDIPETGGNVEAEAARLDTALAQVRAAMQRELHTAPDKSSTAAKILAAHLAFLDDPDLRSGAESLIGRGKSAAHGWHVIISERVTALQSLNNPILAERAADLQDVERKVLLVLLGKEDDGHDLPEHAILIADDLLPSQLTGLDASRISGLCLAGGGPTSHVAILSAAMGIPAMVAAGAEVLRVPDGAVVILDADQGVLHVHPPAEQVARIAALAQRRLRVAQENRANAQSECRMIDGTRIEVVANLGGPGDVPAALAAGAEGCGLLRSEFLFLNRDTAPDEDEQYRQYQAILDGLQGRPLVIRTLDAGGDKDLPYAELPHDENPALGLRGVRMSLWRPELMRQQLRAILRVRPLERVSIMVPMIATLADLRVVRTMLDEESAALGVTAKVRLGIMVEVPSAAVMADKFAAEADFFSVGTNDLTQYALAMDRMNPHLAKQLDAFHPAVLRLIATAAKGAAAHGRWVGVCGGLASFPLAAPVLIGLGVTELSVTARALPDVKAMVRGLTRDICAEVAAQALEQDSAEAVRQLLAQRWPEL